MGCWLDVLLVECIHIVSSLFRVVLVSESGSESGSH